MYQSKFTLHYLLLLFLLLFSELAVSESAGKKRALQNTTTEAAPDVCQSAFLSHQEIQTARFARDFFKQLVNHTARSGDAGFLSPEEEKALITKYQALQQLANRKQNELLQVIDMDVRKITVLQQEISQANIQAQELLREILGSIALGLLKVVRQVVYLHLDRLNPDLIDDLLQEAFVYAITGLKSFDPEKVEDSLEDLSFFKDVRFMIHIDPGLRRTLHSAMKRIKGRQQEEKNEYRDQKHRGKADTSDNQ